MTPYFCVWKDLKTRKWGFTLWAGNGRSLMESTHPYASKRTAANGAHAVRACFVYMADVPVYDRDGNELRQT